MTTAITPALRRAINYALMSMDKPDARHAFHEDILRLRSSDTPEARMIRVCHEVAYTMFLLTRMEEAVAAKDMETAEPLIQELLTRTAPPGKVR